MKHICIALGCETIILIALTAGCVSKPPRPPTISAKSIPSPTPPIAFRELERYRSAGRVWRNVVVPRNIKKEEIIALAKYLHRTDPITPFHMFDDDKEFRKFMDSDINYGIKAYPYPEAWVKRHYIAIINKILDGGGARWQLYAMDAGMKYADDDVVIANLE